MRRILGIALSCGALAVLGESTARAQAQPSNPALFVQLLLARESNQIMKESVTIAQQNRDIRLLNLLMTETPSAKVQRMIAQLTKTIDTLQFQIVGRSAQLFALNAQVGQALKGLPTPNSFTSLASSNAAIIGAFIARPPFGITPVTASQ